MNENIIIPEIPLANFNNNRATWALKCLQNGSGITISNLTADLDANNFSLSFWIYPTSTNLSIFNCENLDIILAENEILITQNEEIYRVPFETKNLLNSWNNLILTFKDKEISFYVHGIQIFSHTLTKNILMSDAKINILKASGGYIKSLSAYKMAINSTEISTYIYKTMDDYIGNSGDLYFLFDFNSKQIASINAQEVTFTKDDAYSLVNLINALEVGPESYVFDNAPELKDIYKYKDDFSLYFKIFPKFPSSDDNNQIIFSTGRDYKLILKDNFSESSLDLWIETTHEEYCLAKNAIFIEKWNSILVTFNYDYGFIKAFVNTSDCPEENIVSKVWVKEIEHIKIGNECKEIEGELKWHPFIGYISTVAVFEGELKYEDAIYFNQNTDPFIFEKGIKLLYTFDTDQPMELVLSKKFKLNSNKILLIENSNSAHFDSISHNFRCTSEDEKYPENLTFEPKVALSPMAFCFENVYGIGTNSANMEIFNKFIPNKFINEGIFKKFLLTKTIKKEDIFEFLSTLSSENLYVFLHGYLNSNRLFHNNFTALQSVQRHIFALLKDENTLNAIKEKVNLIKNTHGYKQNICNNNRSHFALKIDNLEGKLSYLSIDSLNIAKGLEGECALDIWFLPDNENYTLFSQKDGFKFIVVENKLYFCHKFYKENVEISDEIIKGSWNNLFLNYNNDFVIFYLNGVRQTFFGFDGEDILNANEIKVGEGLNGYIRSLRVYSQGLPYQNLIKRIHKYEPLNDENLIALWVDFNSNKANIFGTGSAKLTFNGECSLTTIIGALKSGFNKNAWVLDAKVNPGGFDSGEFSIFVKFFAVSSFFEKQVLVSNGSFESEESIIIYLEKTRTMNMSKICVKVAESTFTTDYAVYNNCWNDILIDHKNGKNFSIYLNGEEILTKNEEVPIINRTKNGEVIIGNGYQKENKEEVYTGEGQHPFWGYISSVSIFEKVVDVDSKKYFHQNEPYIYEAGLKALYSFDNGLGIEMLSNQKISIDDENINFLASTNDIFGEFLAYQYRATLPSPNYSELKMNIIKALAKLFKHYFESVYSIVFDENKLNMICQFGTFGRLEKSVLSNLIYQKEKNIEHVISAIEMLLPMELTWILKTLNSHVESSEKTLVCNATVASVASISAFAEYIKNILESDWASTILNEILTNLKAFITEKNIHLPQIEINSVDLKTGTSEFNKGSVTLRNSEGILDGPEWESSTPDGFTPGLYISNIIEFLTMKLNIDLNLPENYILEDGVYRIKLSVEDVNEKIFKKETFEIDLFKGENNVSFALKELKIKDIERLTKINTTVKFSFSELYDTRKAAILCEIPMNIYVTPSAPIGYISLDENSPDFLPVVELIDMIFDGNIPEEKNEDPTLDLMALIYSNPILTCYNMKHRTDQGFITFKIDNYNENLEINVKEFINSYKSFESKILTDSQIYAYLLNYALNLTGKYSQIVQLMAHDYSQTLVTLPVYPANRQEEIYVGEFEDIKEIKSAYYHAVVRLDDLYYDACLKDQDKETLASLKFRAEPGTTAREYSEKVLNPDVKIKISDEQKNNGINGVIFNLR